MFVDDEQNEDEAARMFHKGPDAGENEQPEWVWECGPHTNVWKGHDARCRKVRVCRDCGQNWQPIQRGECLHCGSDAGPR